MGTYDTLHDGERFEQLKLWGKRLRHLHVGDTVGRPRGGLAPDGTYTVVMRVGGFVHVVGGVIVGWRDEPGGGPELTTRGLRYRAEDWPGGPFGPWYRDADAPAHQRVSPYVDRECPGLGGSVVRLVRSSDSTSGIDVARGTARADVEQRLRTGPTEVQRIEAARGYLADRNAYVDVVCEAAAQLLGVHEFPDRAGERLVVLLSSASADAPEWSHAAATVARYAAILPPPLVATCLSRLADALSDEGRPAEARAGDPGDLAHPAIRRRRAGVAAEDDIRSWLGRYRELDYLAAAEAAVARHGAAVLPAVPLRFWGRDVVVTELAAPLLRPVMGRDFTDVELDWLLEALLAVPGSLESLDRGTLRRALARTTHR